MKNQSLDLNKMGVISLNTFEMQSIEGGSWGDWVAFGALVIGQVGIVAGVVTLNPALIWGGAELSAGALATIVQ